MRPCLQKAASIHNYIMRSSRIKFVELWNNKDCHYRSYMTCGGNLFTS